MTGRQQLWCGSSVEVLGLVRWYLLMSTFGGSINPGDNRGHCATANFSTNKNNFSDLFMTFYMFHWTANREILWKELAAFWNTLSGRKIVHVSTYLFKYLQRNIYVWQIWSQRIHNIIHNVGGMFQRHEARSHVDFDIISAAVNQE